MSIRIYTDGMANAAASEASRSEELTRAGNAAKQPAGAPASEGGDQVQISSLSESIAAGSSQQSAAQVHRLSQIAAQFENGTYHVDAAQLSKAMIANALGGGGEKA
jgi:anti-sigma28 factor (negative regulator of flagellin synthesis)